MPFAFAFVGLMILVIGVRGRANDAGQLLASEFTGAGSFVQWFLAIMVLGLVGYYKPARPITDAMLGLIIVAMIIAKGNPNAASGGLFKQLEDAFQNTKATPRKTVTPAAPAVQPYSGGAGLPSIPGGSDLAAEAAQLVIGGF